MPINTQNSAVFHKSAVRIKIHFQKDYLKEHQIKANT